MCSACSICWSSSELVVVDRASGWQNGARHEASRRIASVATSTSTVLALRFFFFILVVGASVRAREAYSAAEELKAESSLPLYSV